MFFDILTITRRIDLHFSELLVVEGRDGERGPSPASVLGEDEVEDDAVADQSASDLSQTAAQVRVKLVKRTVHADRDSAAADLVDLKIEFFLNK